MACHTSPLVTGVSFPPRVGEESVEKMVNWAPENVSARPDLSILEVDTSNGRCLILIGTITSE